MVKPQVHPDHYRRSYDSKGRFCSYWAQIEETLSANTPPVLEIGVGNATVSSYLKRVGIPLTTLDLDCALSPDVQGNVLHLPFRDGAFGTVMACEVLEHLPFEYFPAALREMARVSSSHLIISLPNTSRTIGIRIQFPVFGAVQRLLELPWLLPAKSVTVADQHFWELGLPDYGVDRVKAMMVTAGLDLRREFRVTENPFHHFFVLRKRGM